MVVPVYAYFRGEEIGTQRGLGTTPGSHSDEGEEPRFQTAVPWFLSPFLHHCPLRAHAESCVLRVAEGRPLQSTGGSQSWQRAGDGEDRDPRRDSAIQPAHPCLIDGRLGIFAQNVS